MEGSFDTNNTIPQTCGFNLSTLSFLMVQQWLWVAFDTAARRSWWSPNGDNWTPRLFLQVWDMAPTLSLGELDQTKQLL